MNPHSARGSKLLLVVWLLVMSSACSGPTGPTGQRVLDVAGVWIGTASVTSITGGECLGSTITAGTPSAINLALTQTGSTVSGTLTAPATGATCTYAGTVGEAAITLNGTRCDLGALNGIPCSNGARRDLRVQAQSLTLTGTSTRLTGTLGETWNVFVSGTGTGVGILTVSSAVTLSK